MEIKFAVVHDLRKGLGNEADLRLRTDIIKKSDALTNLFDGLHAHYSRRATKGFGQFSEDTTNYPFSTKLDEYLSQKDEKAFLSFTTNTMSIAKEHIVREYLAIGGYVLFILFENDSKRHLFITVMRQRRGCMITEDLEIDTADHLEIEKLHIGCLIEIDTWKNNPRSQYITFIKGKNTANTPQYFLRAIGCKEFANSATQTDELVRAVNDFSSSKNYDKTQRQQLRQKVYDYCKGKENIQLDNLSQALSDTEPEEFLEFINNGNYKVGNGFEPKLKNLKKLREVNASGEGIQIKFPLEMLGNRIKLDKERRTVTINNVPGSIIKALSDDQ